MRGSSRAVLVALVALAAPALAACGGGTGAGPSGSATPVANRPSLPRPTALVLQSDDIGAGFLVDPSATTRITLATEMRHESAQARAAERRAFAGGYNATYVRPGDAGVASSAIVYRDAAAARIVSTDPTGIRWATRSVHGHPIRTPRSAPGTPRFAIAGTTSGLPVLGYGWQRGRVLEVVMIFGRHATLSRLMALARTQDARLTHPTFGA